MKPRTKTFDASKLAGLKLGTTPNITFKGESPVPDPSRTWAEMIEADQHGDDAEATTTVAAVQSAKERLEKMLQQVAEEKGAAGVEGLLFAMSLAAETLATDFKDGRFAECPEVLEEDVFRLRRVVNEALNGGAQ